MGLAFIGLMVPLMPFFWLVTRNTRSHGKIFTLFKIWSNWFFVVIGMPFKRTLESDKVKAVKGPVILCANHTSYMDIPIVTRTFWKFHKYIGKAELGSVPLFGTVYKSSNILVDRKNPEDRKMAIQRMKDNIDIGASIVIFPEGSTNKTPPPLNPFKDGAFRVAIEKQVPIIPMTILDNFKILPAKSNRMKNMKNRVIYHNPVHTKGKTLKDLPEIKALVFEAIERPLREEYPEAFEKEIQAN
jgi:1-acyl-sn-glycerol-3-phosphate acyltransferase